MAATAETERAIRQKVMRLSDLLSRREPRAVDEIWSPGFRLVGSEAGEVAEDRDRLAALFAMLFARAHSYAFDFPKFAVDEQGPIAWLFAEGHIVATSAAATDRFPYRLAAVFEKVPDGWRWRLFSGSEPAAPPAAAEPRP